MKLFFKTQANAIAWLLLLTVSLAGCHKKDPVAGKAGEILSFKIEAIYNAAILSADVKGVIKNDSILLALPNGIDLKSIIATVEFSGTSLVVNGVTQVSGQTPNNFENSVTYVVINSSGALARYIVTVVPFDEPGIILTAFSFETKYNSLLASNYVLNISGNWVKTTIITTAPKTLVASFATTAKEVLVNAVKQESTQSVVDFSNPVIYTLVSATGFKKKYTVKINWNYEVPHIYITTDNNVPIVSKEDYVPASIRIEGNGGYNDFTATTKIKGRGNSTWGMPKKPYRLKLDKKASIFGLPESKNWVLLANYLDGTLMLNSVAMKTGQLLEIPYTNHVIPVDVTVNGQFAGSYVFTEQVEVAANRVPIENGGVLLELDQNFDEPWEFKSNAYQLPVMVKYPELTAASELETIKDQFHQMEVLVAATNFPDNNYADYIDIESLVNYFIVYNLTDNEEINHPKSTYIYKPLNGKFTMGPIWDFDWAFGYEGSFAYFNSYTNPMFWSTTAEPGTPFFSRFLTDPAFKTLYKQKWAAFKTEKLPLLLKYVDDYASLIENSREADYILWHTGSGFFLNDAGKLHVWLQNRADYIDTYLAGF